VEKEGVQVEVAMRDKDEVGVEASKRSNVEVAANDVS